MYKTDKYKHGLIPLYEELIERYKPESLLEIGVFFGGSLDYFGDRISSVVGVDINPVTKKFKSNVKFIKMDATNRAISKLGKFDFIIDDGSHREEDIRKTFEHLKNNFNILYIIEDWATNLIGMSGYGAPERFIEELKKEYDVEAYYDKEKSYAIIKRI